MSRAPAGLRVRLLSVGAIVVGLGAVYGIGAAVHPATVGAAAHDGQATRTPAITATRACAAPGSSGATAASLATVAVPGSAQSGRAVVTRLSGTGSIATGPVVQTLSTPGTLAVSPVPILRGARAAKAPASGKNAKNAKNAKPSGSGTGIQTLPAEGGVMVQASGAMAQGLAVEQTSPAGLATAQCQAPGTDFWFVGPGATVAANLQLYLMNTDSEPADVQVEALTDSGPLLGSTDTGIVVPPHGIVVQSLGQRLRTARVIALHISTSMGRIVAAVRQTKRLTASGGWIPSAAPPARQIIIPGLPGSSGARQLYVTVPGTKSAELKVTAVTSKGSYQPTGGNGIDLPGDSADSVQLPSLSGVAAAIKITSTVPVTASILVPGGAAGAPGAISAAALPIAQQGVTADNPTGKPGSADLVISAPDGAVTVQVATATAKSAFTSQAGTTEHVAAKHSIIIRVKPPRGHRSGVFSVLVTPQPGSGPVYVGRLIRSDGQVRSILPMPSALTVVPLPIVQAAANAVTAGHR